MDSMVTRIWIDMVNLIRNSAIYHRLKASRLYDWYWKLIDRKVIYDRDQEVEFYKELLGMHGVDTLIFDIGANHGFKTDIFLRLGVSVVSVDPDPVNYHILTSRFHRYRLKRRRVAIVPKAVSQEAGRMSLWIDTPGSAKNTLSQKWVSTLRNDSARFGDILGFSQRREVETVTVADLISSFGKPLFVKIDVEGHEPSVLAGMREAVPYLSFEINLPEFVEEGVECIRAATVLDGRARFNVAGVNLSSGFLLPTWVAASELESFLRATTERSVEVFCRSPSQIE